ETLSDEEISQRLEAANQMKEAGPLQMLVDVVPENFFFSLSNNTLMLQIIFFGIFFSISLLLIPKEQSEPVIKFINGFLAVFLKMVDFVMQAAPFFVFALLAGVVSKMAGDDVGKVIEICIVSSWYILTVLIGLILFIFILCPLAVKHFTTKITYPGCLEGKIQEQAMALSISSSAATLSKSMKCIDYDLGLNK